MKITVVIKDPLDRSTYKIYYDQIDITNKVSDIKINISTGAIPSAIITFMPDELEIQGNFDITKVQKDIEIIKTSQKLKDREMSI